MFLIAMFVKQASKGPALCWPDWVGIMGNYQCFVQSLERRSFIPVGNGLNRRTLVYDKDVGRAAALAVSHPAAAGRVFNVTDDGFHTLNEIIESICSALGRRPPRFSLSVGPTRGLVGLVETGCRSIGLKPPVTRAMIDKYTEDIAVDGSLIQKELGFMPQYDLKTGWKETIREMRA
jgi:nucleoside-diphosphate-sugar epimerase